MSKPYPPVFSEHPAPWHHEKFIEFVEYKQMVGEPSPHMTLAGWLTENHEAGDLGPGERVWRAGLYGAPYSVLTSEALWLHWPWGDAFDAPAEDITKWIADHWDGFHVRTERRMVRTPKRMAECILSYRAWAMSGEPQRLRIAQSTMSDKEAYDAWYDSIIKNVKFFGRYITIRVVEFLRRYAGAKAELYDIRSIGGESPVRCLSLLYPEHSEGLLVRKSGTLAESLATDLLERVQETLPEVGHYVLAAMLCEYREAYEDRHQYPARTIDQELQYLMGPKGDYWYPIHETRLWEARLATIPHEALGEVNGWNGIRHDLSRWLRDRGENWSDTNYRYPSMEER